MQATDGDQLPDRMAHWCSTQPDVPAAEQRRTGTQRDQEAAMAPRVMTVSGPIPPERVGFALPHEHTGISLWHVANRWDYWELTPDEPVIVEELADFRRRGGATLVDLTLDGVGRDPERLRRMSARSGVQLVMGCGWYRGAYYPAEALINRRT